jgi:EAL domain-containing protein (putative c-di-GMP-specific phosphodiesterase class I)
VDSVPLRDGDIIHIAGKEFRFGLMPRAAGAAFSETQPAPPLRDDEPLGIIHGREVLEEILRDQQVRIVFQPIVDLKQGCLVGYEALGRGTHQALTPNPAALFSLAEKCGMARQLSGLFRAVALKEAAQLEGHLYFFFNIHPVEMKDEHFVASLGQAAASFKGGRELVIEIHEDFVSDAPAIRRLHDQLGDMGIRVAYDDFGSGQARFNELADTPPDFLKLDMKLIRGINQAAARQDVVRALTTLCTRLGIRVIAEGIETPEEAACCRQLGCHWAQGFLFGHPLPASEQPRPRTRDTRRVSIAPVLKKLRAPSN